MNMPGRKYNAGGGLYRYGFNGQEKESELNENITTALYWEYDSRIGRRWNVDPVILIGESPYLVNGGNPNFYTDPLGNFKTKFGAKWHSFWHGGGKVGKNKYDEWYVFKDKGINISGNGEVVAKSEYYYGTGRNKYSTAKENLLIEIEIDQDIARNGDKSMYQYYASDEEAGKGALNLGLGVLLPNPVLKTGTAAANSTKVATATEITSAGSNASKGVFSLTKHGELTNGVYTVSKEAMKKHVFNLGQGKSIFYSTINADEAVLKAAQFADEAGIWIGNKAKVPVLNTNVGTLGNGTPTNYINVYRNSNGFIHGSPGTIR